jgi:hypothetical protein
MNFRGRGYFDRRNGEFSIGVDSYSEEPCFGKKKHSSASTAGAGGSNDFSFGRSFGEAHA